VVDDHRTFAELLSGALVAAGMDAVGIAFSTAQGVAMAQELQPDIVVMDIQMPRQDGLSATRQIREATPNAVVAVVTAHHDPEWVVRAAQAGTSAFISKDGSLSEMIDVVSRVQTRRCWWRRPPSPAARASPRHPPSLRGCVRSSRTGAGGAGVPRQRHAGRVDHPGAGDHAGDLLRLREVAARQARGALHLEAVIKAQQLQLISAADDR
jgi:CheY-like chemotaxis protein